MKDSPKIYASAELSLIDDTDEETLDNEEHVLLEEIQQVRSLSLPVSLSSLSSLSLSICLSLPVSLCLSVSNLSL